MTEKHTKTSLYRMGATQNTVHKMRKEVENAIKTVSEDVPDSSLWWEPYSLKEGRLPIENLIDDLERIFVKYAEKLV